MFYQNTLKKLNGLKTILVLTILGIFAISTGLTAMPEPGTTGGESSTESDAGSIAYQKLLTQPNYRGGLENLEKQIEKEIVFPTTAMKYGLEGKVFVQVKVAADGSIAGADVMKTVVYPSGKKVAPDAIATEYATKALEEEALRTVNSLTEWEPGVDPDGTPVSAYIVLPIVFKLI